MLVYKCRNCGGVLFVYGEGRRGIPTPLEVAEKLNYVCPCCGFRITGLMNPDWREHIRIRPRMKPGAGAGR